MDPLSRLPFLQVAALTLNSLTDPLKTCEPCGNIYSNYTAEIRALKAAVETVHEAFETGKEDPTDLMILTDSR